MSKAKSVWKTKELASTPKHECKKMYTQRAPTSLSIWLQDHWCACRHLSNAFDTRRVKMHLQRDQSHRNENRCNLFGRMAQLATHMPHGKMCWKKKIWWDIAHSQIWLGNHLEQDFPSVTLIAKIKGTTQSKSTHTMTQDTSAGLFAGTRTPKSTVL